MSKPAKRKDQGAIPGTTDTQIVDIDWTKLIDPDAPEGFPVAFEYLWQACGYSTKGNAIRVLQGDYKDAQDFLSDLIKSTGGRPATLYYLTLDAAKHFAMKANTPEGAMVRDYFIMREKQAQALSGGAPADTRIHLTSEKERRLMERERRLMRAEERKDRTFQAKILAETLDRLKALGQLPEDVEAAHRVKVVEIATGAPMPRLLPEAPAEEWLSPTEIAQLLGVTPNAVGRAITSCGLRGTPHEKRIINTAKHANRTITSSLWDAEAVRQIRLQIEEKQAPAA